MGYKLATEGFRPMTRLGRFVLLLIVIIARAAYAQEGGTVTGVVVSTWDGTPLPSVVVTIRGTTLATQTDGNGRYELKNVPSGDQVLRFSKSGYASATVTDVRVLVGQATTVNGNLRPEFYEMEEYEVTAEEFAEQTEQIIFDRQESSMLVDAIGSDQFSRIGASDAAEALGKVSGASIADGKFAVIRGLADRYTSTTLNGTELPSADPDRKAAQLDLLPTHVISRMDVRKTFSPDMAGGFAGGSLDVVTRSYPDKFFFSMSGKTEYNTQASLNDDFLASDRGNTDWLGLDDGTRELPAIARAARPFGTSRGVDNEPQVERSFKSRQLSPLPRESPLNSSFAMTLGDRFEAGDFRAGYLASLNFKNDYKFYDDGFVRKYGGAGGTELVTDKVDARGVSEYTWSAFSSLTLGWTENHELKFNFLYVQSAEDEAQHLRGEQENQTDPDDPNDYFDQSILHWTERNLTYFQLVGGHDLPELNDISFDWALASSTATQDEPDHRIFQYRAIPENSDFLPVSSGSPQFPTRFWRDLEENNLSARADLTIPLPSYNSGDNFFKTGVAWNQSKRDFFQRGFSMFPRSAQHPFNSTGDVESYLDPANAEFVEYRNFLANITYEGKQTIEAAYAMGDWATLEWLRLVGGARFETTDLSFDGFNQSRNQPLESASIQQDDWLPSLSATISFRDNLQLRAAWSQTVVRPTYREIAPVPIYDIARARQIYGNPDLTFSGSDNYDLRLDWYPRPGELVSVSAFMKQIASPIELSAINANDVVYINSEEAEVFGVEAEFRTSLGNFWKPLSKFTMGFNAAYIVSEVPISDFDRSQRMGNFLESGSSRPLYDQPEFVLNGDLTWDNKTTGTTITLSGGVVGRRLVVYGLTTPDEYEEPSPQLDFFLTQNIGKHWKLKFSARNLLNPAYEVSQTAPATGHVIIESYKKGITFGISLGCEF
jgi:outer membrane receptor protein involved in Fe transport